MTSHSPRRATTHWSAFMGISRSPTHTCCCWPADEGRLVTYDREAARLGERLDYPVTLLTL